MFLEGDLAKNYSLKLYINKHNKQLRTNMKEINVLKRKLDRKGSRSDYS